MASAAFAQKASGSLIESLYSSWYFPWGPSMVLRSNVEVEVEFEVEVVGDDDRLLLLWKSGKIPSNLEVIQLSFG